MIKFKKQSKQFDGVYINTFYFVQDNKEILVETLTYSKILDKDFYINDLLNTFKTITKENLYVNIDGIDEDNTVDAELFINDQHFVGLTLTFDYYDDDSTQYHQDIVNLILDFVKELKEVK